MAKVKVLHINTFQRGGSGIAATRLSKALRQHGYDSRFLFLDKGITSPTEFQYTKRRYWWILILRILKKLHLPFTTEQRNDYSIRKFKYKLEMFSFANTSYTHLHEHPLVKDSDIIHLHWVSDFLDYESFFRNINKPIVWTMHDMNVFLGGFHYEDDALRFGAAMQKLNEKQVHIKQDALQHIAPDKLSIVSPSRWLCRLSKASQTLNRFPHYHIPNGIDASVFKPVSNETTSSKTKLNILFVAESLHNHRKGFDILLSVLKEGDMINRFHFMAVGHVKSSSRIPQITYYGSIYSEARMSELYNEADIFVLPSREDNLPNAMVESLCCGTPVVGFAVGGIRETVVNGKNGYLSGEVTPAGLKQALLTCAENIDAFNREVIADEAHRIFSAEVFEKSVSELYHHVLKTGTTTVSKTIS